MRAVIDALFDGSSRLHVTVKTSAPRHLFGEHDGTKPRPAVAVVNLQCDAGVAQIDSLDIDVPETVRRAKAFQTRLPSLVDEESAFLRRHRANLVVGDIPPLAFAAAAAAGLPSMAIANFTWDWIYESYADVHHLVEDLRRTYQSLTLALRLPMWGGFAGLERKARDIPFIAYRSQHHPDDVRRTLGLPDRMRGGPLVLPAFGGHGLGRLATNALGALPGYTVVPPASTSPEHLRAAGLRYQDLIKAADVVVTKPGYSVISEAIANGAALLYTSRGHFVEYDVLVREMPRYVRARFIEPNDLLSGNWSGAIERLLAQPAAPDKPSLNGAQLAAEEILRLART